MSDPDPGVALERTALAWQRTALSLVAGCAITARLQWSTAGIAAVAPLLVATVLASWVLRGTRPRVIARAAGMRVGLIALAGGMMGLSLLISIGMS